MQQSGVFSNLTSIVLWREQSSVRAQLAAKKYGFIEGCFIIINHPTFSLPHGHSFLYKSGLGVARQDRRMRKEKKEMPQPACVIV